MIVPQGHDSSSKRDTGDGIEIGKMRENKMNRSKYHNEISLFDLGARRAEGVIEFLQGLATSNHIHNINTDLNHKLLRHHNVKPKLLPKRILAQFMVPVKPLPWNHLVHLNHLPKRVQSHHP